MGRFKIDDILRKLGEPNPSAPVERVPGTGAEQAAGAMPVGAASGPSIEERSASATPNTPAPEARFEWDVTVPEATPSTGAPTARASEPADIRGDAAQTPAPKAGQAAASDAATARVGTSAPATTPARNAGATPPPTKTPAPSSASDGMQDLYQPEDYGTPGPQDDLEALLAQRGIATAEQLLTAQRIQKQAPGRRMLEILKEQGCDERAVQAVIAELAGMTFVVVDPKKADAFDHEMVAKLTHEFCRNSMVLPLRRDGSRAVVATPNPDDVFLLEDVRRRLGVAATRHVLATPSDIYNALQSIVEAHAHAESEDFDVDAILAGVADEEDDVEVEKEDVNERDLEAEAESSPIVRYVNHIIQSALKDGASDIHIEPDENSVKVRFRIDGVLFESMSPPKKMHAALTSRIKIMSNLDIAERRLPQDGRIRATVLGRKLDLRVSTVPTPKGEKTVMRILDSRSISVSLDDLGFSEDTLTIWKNQIDQPHGIILVTGPTGSGKTTTLYASIRQMDTRRMNVSTVEDPIEYNLNGITQIQTHEKIGMTFARALKSLLRQDPDVIMVGEIRDQETAHTAIQAALTGHLVLSTLHTNDAPSSVTRMINIGIEPFLVGAALNGVLAQRLVRRICKHCGEEREIPSDMREMLLVHGIDRPTLRIGSGCSACRQTGYTGRLGLYELLVLDDFLRDKIAANPNVVEFRRLCIERGMTTLRDDGFSKVREGRTTVEEVLRVTEATI
ncbi:MAG: Flp pilus assembly complex ATPase component TadA [Planctomycetaceae bacterium]|nr:Flp pilus assembly complex ATPase component TadA [Planctomycetaceae bacterium]